MSISAPTTPRQVRKRPIMCEDPYSSLQREKNMHVARKKGRLIETCRRKL